MAAKGRSRRQRVQLEEEHENHERWMVSYADMLTLLFVLFVVLFAISQLDKEKFDALKASLSMGFGADSAAFTGQQSPMDGQSAPEESFPVDLSPGVGNERSAEQQAADRRIASAAVTKATRDRVAALQAAAQNEVRDFERVKRMILAALREKGVSQPVQFTIDQRGMVVTVLTTDVVFENGRAELLPGGRKIIDAVGPPIKTLPNNIEVDGHTNKLPVHSAAFPTNWELSTARATTVLRHLASESRIPAARLSAAGFADQRPLYPYSDSRAMTLNRRVEIVVLSRLGAEEKTFLPYAAGGR